MAKGKRVSNKSGGDPGKRSGRGKDRAWANLQRRRALARPQVTTPDVVRSTRVARIPGPPRIARAMSTIKRFFSRGGRS